MNFFELLTLVALQQLRDVPPVGRLREWPLLYSLPAAAMRDSSFSRSFSDMLFLYALPPVFSRLDIDFWSHASLFAFSPPVPTCTDL